MKPGVHGGAWGARFTNPRDHAETLALHLLACALSLHPSPTGLPPRARRCGLRSHASIIVCATAVQASSRHDPLPEQRSRAHLAVLLQSEPVGSRGMPPHQCATPQGAAQQTQTQRCPLRSAPKVKVIIPVQERAGTGGSRPAPRGAAAPRGRLPHGRAARFCAEAPTLRRGSPHGGGGGGGAAGMRRGGGARGTCPGRRPPPPAWRARRRSRRRGRAPRPPAP